ncbi:hypothetical protein C9J85_13730 [Haloferax sp. wsp5]|nr:hypothetical protein C9J85_13730 [Haloferax sp. wsp5]
MTRRLRVRRTRRTTRPLHRAGGARRLGSRPLGASVTDCSNGVPTEPADQRPAAWARLDPPASARRPRAHRGRHRCSRKSRCGVATGGTSRFAERAAATENPREAREHLQAAREAAEALDAARSRVRSRWR